MLHAPFTPWPVSLDGRLVLISHLGSCNEYPLFKILCAEKKEGGEEVGSLFQIQHMVEPLAKMQEPIGLSSWRAAWKHLLKRI